MPIARPDITVGHVEVLPGKGIAYYAARITQLQKQQHEALQRGDFDRYDELQKEIQQLEVLKMDAGNKK